MAGDAVPRQRRVVHECDGRPVRRYVTVGALANRLDVIGGLRRGADETARRVTTGAGRIGGRERAASVAALAGQVPVSAVEGETRAEVVEVLRGLGERVLRKQQARHGEQDGPAGGGDRVPDSSG